MIKRPKRRKYKDNPYTIMNDEENNLFTVIFKDSRNIINEVKITKEIFDAFNRFELDDLSELNEYDNHIEHFELPEESLYKRSFNQVTTVEDYIIKKNTFENLIKAINTLSQIQKRRMIMYFFNDLNTKEIAEIEKCTPHSIRVTIRKSIEKLKKNLEN